MRQTRSSSAPDTFVPMLETSETRRASTNDSQRQGAILVSESSSHQNQQYIYPGDIGYEDALNERLRRDEEEEIENQRVENHIDLNILIAKAKASHDNSSRMKLMEDGLNILFSQNGKLDLQVIEFINLNLSDAEIAQILQLYTDKPQKPSTEGSEPLQLMDGIVMLTGNITKKNAQDFQTFSDKFKNKKITPLTLFVNRDAIYTITNTLKQKAQYIGLSNEEAENWLTMWDHQTLAKWVSNVWNNTSNNTHINLAGELEAFSFDLSDDKLHIMNQSADQEKLLELNKIFDNHPPEMYSSEAFQKRAVKILMKKIPNSNIFKRKMEELFSQGHSNSTVIDFVDCFNRVRERARKDISAALEYGCTAPLKSRSLKDSYYDKKRKEMSDSNKSQYEIGGTNKQRDEKRKKSLDLQPFQSRRDRFDPDNHCWTCGMENHRRTDKDGKPSCFMDMKPEHPDRNVEEKQFHLSRKGRQWWIDTKLGPFVNKKFLLNGSKRDEPVPEIQDKTQSHCKYTHILNSAVINNSQEFNHSQSDMNTNHTSHSDSTTTSANFLNIQISLPLFQMAPKVNHPVEEAEMVAENSTVEDAEDAAALKTAVANINVRSHNVRTSSVRSINVQALLDSGCLVGDCMSQKMVDKLKAAHLIVYINTTICSGFDNKCKIDFQVC